jgi:hypothetical protein
MEIDFPKLMSEKSEEQLQEYIDNYQKYTPNAIYAAVDQLKKRGRNFSADEISRIENNIRNEEEIRKQRVEYANDTVVKKWEENVVDDINLPQFYSEKAIYLFSAAFSVVFGSILLAINVNNAGNKRSWWKVIAFAILYTIAQIWILSFLPSVSGIGIAFGLTGGFLLNYFFWKKYIGKNVKYRAKPVWIPLIIGVGLSVLLIILSVI